MQEDFFRRFIEEEKYLQNPPLETKKFIGFCKKRGIETDESELEFFEKEGLLYPIIRIDRPIIEEEWIKFKKDDGTFCRPARQGLLEGEEKIRKYKEKYYSSYGFNEYHKDFFLNWLEEGYLFDPSTKSFKEWSSFKDDELDYDSEKIISFYSSFQIYWLEILKKDFTVKINFAGDKINVSSNSHCIRSNSGSFLIDNIDEFKDKFNEMASDELFNYYFNFENKKKCLNKQYKNFKRTLEFLLSIEYIYAPYGKSSSKTISYSDMKWHEKKNRFDPKEELATLKFTIQEVANIYYKFSEKTREILGVKRDDWIQLWKSFAWNKKDKLEGHIRLGIEYLQWSLMLKRFIENYCGREILDIDEMSNISPNDILKLDPPKMDQYGLLLRATRNKRYFDLEKNKSYFYDKYKRLFYLANNFELNYQPRIIVFVEGKTEEEVLPKFFEWFTDKPQNSGVQIINLDGISKFFGQELKLKDPQTNKYKKSQLNNFNNLISYNLRKWQIIPFFVGDNENNIKELLKSGISINFSKDTENFTLPKKWQYIWNKDFEFDNFTDNELANAISYVLNKKINVKKVKEVRDSDSSINGIDEQIHNNKIKIAKKLHDNLLKYYRDNNDNEILNRPIFKMINRILDLAWYNHSPTDTLAEKNNKEIFLDFLKGNIKD